MSIYSTSEKLFSDLVKYNESNIEFMGSLQIPMTNIYYITFLDPTDNKINNFLMYLDNSETSNPFININSNVNIDFEQICKINLMNNSLNQIDGELSITFENAQKSNSKISVVLDIGLLFDIITLSNEEDNENHLYDFILHKLKNKVDKLFILDTKNRLMINDDISSVIDELKLYLIPNRDELNIISDTDVTIYRYHDGLYWRILDLNKRIEHIDSELKEDFELYEIDDKEAILKTVKISKICFTNLFEMHSIVLHPLDKLKTISVFQ
jgi:hypothetical protein